MRMRENRASNLPGIIVQFSELSYANETQHRLTQWFIRSIETISGRNHFVELYEIWRREIVPAGRNVFRDMLELIDIRLEGPDQWPPADLPRDPIVMIANHPFGIGDGIAALALAEQLGRPFRVLIHNDLLRVPEIRPYALPICFDETKEALAMNMATRHEAARLLKEGVTIVIFPAGGVATARKGFGKAQDLPWKMFPAKLIRQAQASVIPVYFHGQNGWLFHLVSKFSMTLRLSLLIREFRRLSGKAIRVQIGELLPWDELEKIRDRQALLQHLHDAVFALGSRR